MPDKGCGCTCNSIVVLFGGLDEKDKCAPGPDVGRDDKVDEEEAGEQKPDGTPTVGGRRGCRGDELALAVPPVPMMLLLAPASRSDPPLLPLDCLRACCCAAADSVAAADEPPAPGPASSFGAVHAKLLLGAEVRRAPSDNTAGSSGSDKVACAKSRESITAPKGLLFGSSKSRGLLRRSYVGDGAGVLASMGLMFALVPPPPPPPPLADTCATMAASARSWEALGESKREACC